MDLSKSSKEWKIRQAVFHTMQQNFTDDLNQVDMEWRPDTIIKDAIDYVHTEDMGWVYPAKSYIVGICYAYWLSLDFSEDFYTVLDDPDLLYNNDPYFVPYSEDKAVYDAIIEACGLPLPMSGVVPHVRRFYADEILLGGVS